MNSDQDNEIIDPPNPEVSKNRRISKVWIIPIIALLLGAWLVKNHFDSQGHVVDVTFKNAEGITADKTEVRCRSVVIGKVESVTLDDNLNVLIEMRIKNEHTHLVSKNSRFWVVRPRVSGTNISGLGTIITGSYIELDPGLKSAKHKHQFTGLEDPPLTPSTVPGLRLSLISPEPGSVGIGTGLYFKGTLIGRVESRNFHQETRNTSFGVFIEEKYALLVCQETRFWRDNGLKLDVGANGFKLDLPSLDSLLAGRINLGVPNSIAQGTPLEDGSTVILFEDKILADASTFDIAAEFLLLVDQSVRGLSKNAPVEFRGLPIGRVKEISYQLAGDFPISKIPVLIQLDKRLMKKHFPVGIKDEEADYLEKATRNGLRAALKSSSLLTGQLVVDLDYYSDLPKEEIGEFASFKVLPTAESGLARIEDRLAAVLKKINALPIEPILRELKRTAEESTATMASVRTMLTDKNGVVADTQRTMQEANVTLKSLRAILENNELKSIPADIRTTLAQLKSSLKPFSAEGKLHGDLLRTMDEIRATVRSIERTSDAIADKPNSLLFGKDKDSKKIPRAPRSR